MIADIASGNTDAADVFFLVAVIVAVVAAILSIAKTAAGVYAPALSYVAIACVAFGFMLL